MNYKSFALGLLIGGSIGAIAYVIGRKKEREICEDEINQVREYYRGKRLTTAINKEDTTGEVEEEENNKNKFHETSSLEGVVKYSPSRSYSSTTVNNEETEKIINNQRTLARQAHEDAVEDHKRYMADFYKHTSQIATFEDFERLEDKYGADNTARYTYYIQSGIIVNEENPFMTTELVDEQIEAFFGDDEEALKEANEAEDTCMFYNSDRCRLYTITWCDDVADLGEYHYDENINPKPYKYPAWFDEREHILNFFNK